MKTKEELEKYIESTIKYSGTPENVCEKCGHGQREQVWINGGVQGWLECATLTGNAKSDLHWGTTRWPEGAEL